MSDVVGPQSALTRERPDIWQRAVAMATRLTSYEYTAKLPLPDGTIYACGGGYGYYRDPPTPKTPAQIEQERRRAIELRIANLKRLIEEKKNSIDGHKAEIERLEQQIKQLEEDLKEQLGLLGTSEVFVPEGAMEWLLHEVGHWIAATPCERLLPNYGYGSLLRPEIVSEMRGLGTAREWQAWAFEEVIFGPFGHSRNFAAPTYRGGVAYAKNIPIPVEHLRHVGRQVRAAGIDPAEWRALYGEWIAYESQRDMPSWKRPN